MFETSQQTNQRLYRNILNGKQYEAFFPKSYCKRLSGGKGNTEYSVNQMVRVVELYGNQMRSIHETQLKNKLLVELNAKSRSKAQKKFFSRNRSSSTRLFILAFSV